MSKNAAAFPTRPVAQLLGSNGPVHAVAYSASPGTYILTGSADRSIRLYNPSSTTTTTDTTSTSSFITTTTTSHRQPQAAAAAAAAAPPPAGRLIQTYSSHAYEVLSLAVARSNATFASAGGDRAVLLWDVSTGKTIRRFGDFSSASSSSSSGGGGGGHTGRVNAVCFAGSEDDGGNESLLVSAGLDCTVRVWDVKAAVSAGPGGGGGGSANRPVQVLKGAKDAVTSLAVVGPEILAGSVDGRVRCYDVRMGRCVTDVFPGSVTSLCLARDGRTMLVGTLDSKIRLMDRRDGTCLRTYGDAGWRNEEFRVQSVLGGGERYVVTGDEMTGAGPGTGTAEGGGNQGRVWAWDLLTGKLVATVPVPWWDNGGSEARRKVIGRDGKQKERKNVVSCIAWKEGGFGDQFCVGGTSGVVTVFGHGGKG